MSSSGFGKHFSKTILCGLLSVSLAFGGVPTRAWAEAVGDGSASADGQQEEVMPSAIEGELTDYADDSQSVTQPLAEESEYDGDEETLDVVDTSSSAPSGESVASETATQPSGEWGECSWSIDPEGILDVWPNEATDGKLADSRGVSTEEDQAFFPWYPYRNEIKSVSFDTAVKLPPSICGMFAGCVELKSLDLSKWDTSMVEDMSHLFEGCSKLESLNLSSWDTSSLRVADNMFDGCAALMQIAVGAAFETSKAFPAATSETALWYSSKDETWYSVEQIMEARSGLDDVYISEILSSNKSDETMSKTTDLVLAPAPDEGDASSPLDADKRSIEDANIVLIRSVYALAEVPAEPAVSVFFFASDGSYETTFLTLGDDYEIEYRNNSSIGQATVVITGCGNYTGTREIPFRIVDKIDISDEDMYFAIQRKAVYRGRSIDSVIERAWVGKGSNAFFAPVLTRFLFEGEDYTCEYRSNNAPGTGTVVIRGKGIFTGERRENFAILGSDEIDLGEVGHVNMQGALYYQQRSNGSFPVYAASVDGSPVHPKFSVTANLGSSPYIELAEGKEYEAYYPSDSSQVDSYSSMYLVAARGINDVTGEVMFPYIVSSHIDVNSLNINIMSLQQNEYLYQGKKVEPKLLNVSDDFIEGRDYRLTYENNNSVGTCTVIIHGMGRFYGTKKLTVPIVQKLTTKLLSDCKVSVKDAVYTGDPLTPKVIVTDPKTGRMIDCSLLPYAFIVSYTNNTKVGTGTVHVQSAYSGEPDPDMYTGSTTVQFKITAAPMSRCEVKAPDDCHFDGTAQKPTVNVTDTLNGRALTSGTDFTVTYKNNVNVGSATVTVTGKGNYTGTATTTFKIEPAYSPDNVVKLTEGKRNTRFFESLDIINYKITMTKGGYITLHWSYGDASGGALAELDNSNGDPLSMFPTGRESSNDKTFGPIALAPGTYYFKQMMTVDKGDIGMVTVWYTDSMSSYPGWSGATFERPLSLTDKAHAYNNGGPIGPMSTPVEVGNAFTGTINAKFIPASSGLDIDFYSFVPTKDGDYRVEVECADPITYMLVDETGKTVMDGSQSVGTRNYPWEGGCPISSLDLNNLKAGKTYYLAFFNYYVNNTDAGTIGIKTGPYRGTVIKVPAGQLMYRLYNPNSGEHFYTANTVERNALAQRGWKYEGIGWIAPKSSKTPVYRLYNANAGDHHYTTNVKERDALKRAGWKYEGIGWYSDDAKGVPLYRQYNPYAKSGSHNYTTSKAENDALVSRGWKAEGIGWYGVKQ